MSDYSNLNTSPPLTRESFMNTARELGKDRINRQGSWVVPVWLYDILEKHQISIMEYLYHPEKYQ